MSVGEMSQARSRRWDDGDAYVEQVIYAGTSEEGYDEDRYDLVALFVAVTDGDETSSCLDRGAIDSFAITVAAESDGLEIRPPYHDSIDVRAAVPSDPHSLLETDSETFDDHAALAEEDSVDAALRRRERRQPWLDRRRILPTVRGVLEAATFESERLTCPFGEVANLGTLAVGLFENADRIGAPSGPGGVTKTTYTFEDVDSAPAVAIGYLRDVELVGNTSEPTLEVTTQLSSTGSVLASDLPAATYRHETPLEL
ncbi:hypothetical protein C494_08362 [Natronorubrum bangense JCM 10635]|uniref:Uncharacterized protein n=1 Tax=Natronorubrum bangense JCM 10635 TaxID=1227500 RepID=L9WIQ8_9EURY|nr:hypothetical protein C494_08362 [Natronorubrum bangense JCM 10635]